MIAPVYRPLSRLEAKLERKYDIVIVKNFGASGFYSSHIIESFNRDYYVSSFIGNGIDLLASRKDISRSEVERITGRRVANGNIVGARFLDAFTDQVIDEVYNDKNIQLAFDAFCDLINRNA